MPLRVFHAVGGTQTQTHAQYPGTAPAANHYENHAVHLSRPRAHRAHHNCSRSRYSYVCLHTVCSPTGLSATPV
ncbi:hypothetical protein BDV95DRAFT_583308 [Massariosphaeria phaeospora]|uniref:Uncharacterized protein n=1 Tax=Massariosphaeria phaeospora TaxID=100035 RepID=A0A7C8I047_9PLEO|nr:hypothetical protein BDV95DRAFT_583308 [Massariosphaeria phaeospora]